MDPWKRRFLLETIISRFHVNFLGCTWLWIDYTLRIIGPSYRRGLTLHSRVPGSTNHQFWDSMILRVDELSMYTPENWHIHWKSMFGRWLFLLKLFFVWYLCFFFGWDNYIYIYIRICVYNIYIFLYTRDDSWLYMYILWISKRLIFRGHFWPSIDPATLDGSPARSSRWNLRRGTFSVVDVCFKL